MKKWRSPHDGGNADSNKKKALILAILLSFLAFGIQLAGSYYTGSIALLGDTVHLFTDLFSLLMSLVALILAARPTTELRSFGLYRLEVLASFINALLLLLVSVALIWESVERLLVPKEVLALPLLVVSVLGLVLNLLSAAALFWAMKGDHSHDHHHGHHHHGEAHHHEDRNLRSALLHVVSDALGSVAVIIGAIVIQYTGYMRIDAWIGILLSLLIAYWSIRLLLDTSHVLLESTPKHIKLSALLKDIHGVSDKIRRVEDVHVWEITSRMYAATGEIVVDLTDLAASDRVRQQVLAMLEERYGIAHAVLVMKPHSVWQARPKRLFTLTKNAFDDDQN